MSRWLPVLTAGLLLSGCAPTGCGSSDIRLNHEVAVKDVVGVWSLDAAKLKWLVESEGYRPPPGAVHEIELRPDGTCRFRSVQLEFEQHPAPRFVDSEGTWALVPTMEKARWSSKETKMTVLSLNLKKKGVYSRNLDFTELSGVVELWEFWGDPDESHILNFARKKPDSSAESAAPGGRGSP